MASENAMLGTFYSVNLGRLLMLLPKNDRRWSKVFAACLFALFVTWQPQLSLADSADVTQLVQGTMGAEQTTSDVPDVSESDQDNEVGEAVSNAAGEAAPDTAMSQGSLTTEIPKVITPVLSYSAHVQNKGWMGYVDAGKTAGTTGKSLNMVALKVRLRANGEALASNAISVEAHVSGIGWVDAVGNDAQAGTTGRSKAIEAVRIKLSDELSSEYSIWYRVHSSNFGWLDWACDGGEAGSTGYGRGVQAIQILILKKGASAPGKTVTPFRDRKDEPPSIVYKAHVAKIGWQGSVKNGQTAGTTGRSLQMEALSAQIDWYGHQGNVELRGHVQNVGWQSWKSGSAGTTGKSKRLEAIQLRLKGEVAEQYDVYYRVHCADFGWLAWTKNGASAGSAGFGKAIQAIQVKLVKKGAQGPSTSGVAFKGVADYVAGSAMTINGSAAKVSASGGITTIGSESGAILRSISASVSNMSADGSIQYRTIRQFAGEQANWLSDGAAVNNQNDGLQIKAIAFRLSGDLSQKYDVWYRAHDTSRGWLGWAKNGDYAGVSSGSGGVNALQVVLIKHGSTTPGNTTGSYVDNSVSSPRLLGQVHIANSGWLSTRVAGSDVVLGSTGKGLSLQAIRLGLEGASADSSISVAAHVANIGWQNASTAPNYGGTVGQSKAIQAIKIGLKGKIAEDYDVYYSVYVASYGWLGWTKNGEPAGTEGLSLSAEAIKVVLVKHGDKAPTSTVPAYLNAPTLELKASVSGSGWQGAVHNGGTAGTTGKGRSIQALTVKVSSPVSGGISYAAHVSNIGWQAAVSDGAVAGTVDQGHKIECVKLSLTGDMSKYYNVWYRVHISNYGWMGWTKNGAQAGSTGVGYGVEAIQVKVLPKGAAAPGSTSKPYTNERYHPNRVVLNVPCAFQYPDLPTGCESVALTNALNFYGCGLGKTTIADRYMQWSGSNFVTAFWGNPHSATNGNCISAPGITNTANSYLTKAGRKQRAYDLTGSNFYKLYDYLERGHPVVIWATIGMRNLGGCYATQVWGGRVYHTYTNSHTVVLRGFNRASGVVYLADSIDGYTTFSASRIAQLYYQRGSQAVVIQ